jgi:two-component sensor histidine kinase
MTAEYHPAMTGKRESLPRQFFVLGGIWLAVGLVQAVQTVFGMRAIGMHHAWGRLFCFEIICWLPLVLMTPMIARLGRDWPLQRIRSWPVHALAAAAVSGVSAFWETLLEAWLKPWAPDGMPGPFLDTWRYKTLTGYVVAVVVYGVILVVSWVADSRQKLLRQQAETERLNAQLSLAELTALRRQIEPHFIFNALNCIAGMVREKRTEGAVDMIVALSEVLRRLTRETSDSRVPLAREVEFLEKYCAIQKLRFAERLEVSIEVPEELRRAWVPSLILQPLVENAVKHGIAQRAEGGRVEVSARRDAAGLALRVYNDGPPLPESWQACGGVGIANLRSRLELMFGAAAALQLSSEGIGGVSVCVTLPYLESNE